MTAGDERWDACDEGLISGMVDKICQARRRRRQLGSATVACGLLLCLVLGYGMSDLTIGQKTDRALTCAEVVELFGHYHARQLEASMMEKMDEHFEHCPGCKRKYDRLYGVEARQMTPRDNGRPALALRTPPS